jgi:Flp pilus assembly protein TadD
MLRHCAFALFVAGGLSLQIAQAGDLRVPLPAHTSTTPVQKLNRDGVDAIKKHEVAKAKKLFYQAYMLDPNDPFTLNNLGYISELEGAVDRAQRFYALARSQAYEARVDRTSKDELKGKSVSEAAGAQSDREMQVNRANLEAMGLLQQDRVFEAEDALQQALIIDPKNPFTLNNLGLVKEKEGDLRGALAQYEAAARTNSDMRVIVTADSDARGRLLTDVAERNAKRIERRLPEEETPQRQSARLTFMGVAAINHNNPRNARGYFQEALQLDPGNAFALNNMGYLSEMEGDQETADSFYAKARTAQRSSQKVTAATRQDVIGMPLGQVAELNVTQIDEAIAAEQATKRRRGGPIQLKRRDNTPVVEPTTPPPAAPAAPPTQ